jgi:hypothetical protein
MFIGTALLAAIFLVQSQVPAGTSITATLQSTVRTETSQAGDEVVAVVARSVAVPQGSRLFGRVETIQPATRAGEGRVRLVFREIEFPDGRRIQTWITNSFSADTPKRGARYIVLTGIGAAAGALIGGKTARIAGLLGGTVVGFVIAGSRDAAKPQDLTLRNGQEIFLEFQ